MNYALDALWWRLDQPQVRDLAAVLTAPPLWRSGIELPVAELLGGSGFRLLLALNDGTAELPENAAQRWAQCRSNSGGRLGRYAENLLAFWLEAAPHCRLLAQNLPVYAADGQTLGALDFVAQIGGKTYHLELACKYFGAADGAPEQMRGLNPDDTLLLKTDKLRRQAALSACAEGIAALRQIGIDAATLHRAAIVRGMAFTDSGSLPEHPLYPPNAWCGSLQPDFDAGKRYIALERTAYLAPARAAFEQTLSAEQARECKNMLLAEVAPRDDGFWHESLRFMLG